MIDLRVITLITSKTYAYSYIHTHCTLHIPGKADSADCHGHRSGDRRPDQELVWDRHSVVITLRSRGFLEEIP